MRGLLYKHNFWIHLPRAFVAFSGLYVFHLLSGDALSSWSMIGLAALTLLARVTGSLDNRRTRVELSIVSTACVLIFLQGGFVAHFNSLSLALIVSTAFLLVSLNVINSSIPRGRIAVVPVLFVLFFVSQRYFYPNLESGFADPLVTIGLLAAAWELLSSLIHTKRASPTTAEAGVSIALLLFYYYQGAEFPLVAILSIGVLFAYFFGISLSTVSIDQITNGKFAFTEKFRTTSHPHLIKSYATLFLIGLTTFSIASWIVYSQAANLPVLASLETPSKPLEIEQRNRVEQAFFAFKIPEPEIAKPLEPLNISILEEALKRSAKAEATPIRRKVIVRKARESDKFNVGEPDREKVQTSRILEIPSIRISPVKSSQSLPGYNLTTETDSTGSDLPADPIQYDFGFDGESLEPKADGENQENIVMPSSGGPIRLNQPSMATANTPSQGRSQGRNRDPLEGSGSVPRDAQFSVGFSPQLEYAANVSTELNTRAILEVYLPGSAKWTSNLYLRFNTLEDIESDRFVRSQDPTPITQLIDKPGWNDAPESFRSQSGPEDPWTIALGYDWKDTIPLLGPFDSIKIPAGHSFLANGASFTMRRVSGSGPFAYQFKGAQLSGTYMWSISEASKSLRDRLTHLPLSNKEISYLKRLGLRIGGKNPTPEKFARNAGSYFEKVHPYEFDFQFKPGDEHILVSWLKSRSSGICGYYAGAFTLLARAQGIPSRVVIGALTREFDAKSRKFVVRDRDAHAWAEYLNENNEWVRADLTPISLESPRFTSNGNDSEVYANNIQSALTKLNNSIEISELATNQYPTSDRGSLKDLDQSDTISNSSVPTEIVPSTAALIDKVLERESATATELLEATAAITGEFRDNPPSHDFPPSIEPKVQTPQEKEIFEVEETGEDKVANAIETEIAGTTILPQTAKESWRLSPSVAINYLFVLLFVVFTFTQLRRIKKHTERRATQLDDPSLQDRARAGRLLKEIESFFAASNDLGDQLLQIKQRALRLRYSPKCSATDVKTLRQEFKRSISQR